MIKVQSIVALLDHLIDGSLQCLTINTCIAKNSTAEKLREKKGSAWVKPGSLARLKCSTERRL